MLNYLSQLDTLQSSGLIFPEVEKISWDISNLEISNLDISNMSNLDQVKRSHPIQENCKDATD